MFKKPTRIFAFVIISLVIVIAGWLIAEVTKSDLMPASPMVRQSGFSTPFTLISHEGAPITQEAFRDGLSAVFFGFTHCPEICPSTLNDLALMRDALGARQDKMHIFFITLDPARDIVAVLADYIPYFGSNITGITGTEESIYALARAWGIYWRKTEEKDGHYSLDHTATVFLLDQNSQLIGTIAPQENHDIAIKKLKRLIDKL